MPTVKLYLTCPNCGNSTWIPTNDGDFKCLACGDIVATEDMSTDVEELPEKTKTALNACEAMYMDN